MSADTESVMTVGLECNVDLPGNRTVHSSTEIPRGRPKSGRVWKHTRSEPHSSLTIDKQRKTSWSTKMALRAERKSVKEFEKKLKDAKIKEIQEKKKRQAESRKQKEERQRKSEVVQKIKNSAKIKKMKKSQLRSIEKR